MLGRDISYFGKIKTTQILPNMLEFLIDKIFVMLGGHVFFKTVVIFVGTNCASLSRSFNFTFPYIDDNL